ncbi:aromatic amino acid lyase [Arthrobacter globiformis]|uniref:Histidine ammonia-lyase HutH n=1 Tax=Arthrobacter globiformis TaxID=1665 RepID=A0A328HH04_ARTGO|nr:aromatic amino acid lyase [Arthrobacter globiformis]RAM37772.1 histidine ammonia-lyase HutH [Arthrobacter globiformis]
MIEIDGRQLDLPALAAATTAAAQVRLAPSALDRMAESQRSAQATAKTRPVYGRSTGVGANRSVTLNRMGAGVDVHGLNLLRSHAVDAGRALDRETVRAMLIIRLSQLAAGSSGISPAVAEALAGLINADALPEVREFGGIGTADLPALSGTALTMLGERPTMDGEKIPAPLASWETEDALPFISSNALTIAQAVVAQQKLATLLENLTAVSALSFNAMAGNPEAFGPEVGRAADTPAVADMARVLHELVDGHHSPARIQDPYCLRTLPQVLGSLLEEVKALQALLERLVVAGHENPLVFGSARDGSNGVAHHGLFQMTTLARRVDALHLALGAACPTILRRIDLLCDPSHTGLNRFLAADDAGQSGVMMLEYVAAAAAGRIRANTQPVSLQTVVLSLGAEEDASFASVGTSQLSSTVEAFATIIGIEFLCATRALRLQGRTAAWFRSERLRAAFDAGLELPSDVQDRDLRDDVDRAVRTVLRPGFGCSR